MDKYLWVNGLAVPVSEEVYRAYKRPAWAEKKRREVRTEHERSLDVFMDSGFDISDGGKLVAEIAEDKLMLDMLFTALDELTTEERSLIDALFFDEKSERKLADETGVSRKTLAYRRDKVLAKLKKIMGDF